MYKISVPVMANERFDKENTLLEIKKIDAKRIFLALDMISFNPIKRKKQIEILKPLIDFFKDNGLEVGVWFWALWREDIENIDEEMKIITSFDGIIHKEEKNEYGKSSSAFFCPSSPSFINDTCELIKSIASLNPDIIMFDDDLRFGNLPSGFGCCCDNHLKRMGEIVGENITAKNLEEKIFCGSKNKYRDAWLDSLGNSMRNFAFAVRKTVDSVNSNIRVANCSCMSCWDLDGVDSIEICKILAGKTKPLMRLIGAPYWAVNQNFGQRLQNVIEQERMESSWCYGENIEIMSEGDVFPRPRYSCPSSYLEGFDTALNATGCTNGILKYVMSYTSSPKYESGYINSHVKNKKLYKEIERLFYNKTDVGIRIYESLHKLRNAELPEDKYVGGDYIQNLFYSPSAKMLSDNSIPSTYLNNDSVGMAFGENVKYIQKAALNNGIFIDIKAAKILINSGIDVGIESIGEVIKYAPILYFNDSNEYVESRYNDKSVYKVIPKGKAKVITSCGIDGNEYPDTIYYENNDGQKFVIFAFDAYTTPKERYRSYTMQKLLNDYNNIMGKKLPVKCEGNPDLYILCKQNSQEIAIGLWNFSPDKIDNLVINLTDTYKTAEFINCNGNLVGKKVILDSVLHSFEFCFINLKFN